MISYEEARALTLERAHREESIEVPLLEALDLVLAEDVRSEENIPPFDNSAMDGYAVRFEDVAQASPDAPVHLAVIGEAPAGKPFEGTVGSGEAVAIYTGAPVPAGADTIIPIELTIPSSTPGEVLVAKPEEAGSHIRKAGEDVRAGEVVFPAGTRLTPSVIGVLASCNVPKVRVFRPPVVGIISTGSELIDLGQPSAPGKIRNSNTYLLEALLKELPVRIVNYGVVSDEPAAVDEAFGRALAEVDVLLTTGGVSVGEYDLVKLHLEKAGAKQVFWKVAQKPGKPLALYEHERTVIFGLPGNPAAVHVCFLEYVLPFLLKKLGYTRFEPITIGAFLKGGHRKKPGRLNFLRVTVRQENDILVAEKPGAQGSGVLSTSARAQAIALVPAETDVVPDMGMVLVHYFDEFMWDVVAVGDEEQEEQESHNEREG